MTDPRLVFALLTLRGRKDWRQAASRRTTAFMIAPRPLESHCESTAINYMVSSTSSSSTGRPLTPIPATSQRRAGRGSTPLKTTNRMWLDSGASTLATRISSKASRTGSST